MSVVAAGHDASYSFAVFCGETMHRTANYLSEKSIASVILSNTVIPYGRTSRRLAVRWSFINSSTLLNLTYLVLQGLHALHLAGASTMIR